MRETSCDILIVGGGVGGCAAAMAACSLGLKVIMTEPTDWIGGQLTSQAVPPDEHPWIEKFGCTRRYREFRNRVRQYYRDNLPLTAAARSDPFLNPGGGWVSDLCHEPRIAWQVLQAMLAFPMASGSLTLMLGAVLGGVGLNEDRIAHVTLRTASGDIQVSVKIVLDATETGELLPLAGAEHVLGAEPQLVTNESHAVEGDAQPDNQQAITWVFALGYEEGQDHTILKPDRYRWWRDYHPSCWPGQLLGWNVVQAHTGELGYLPLINPADPEYELLTYRQIVDPSILEPGHQQALVTLVNWPQNDYFVCPSLESGSFSNVAANESKELGTSLLYWLQTEAPRHDGGVGYAGLHLRPDITGTDDGFAMAPYIRESRRIKARFTVLEQHVSAADNPGRDRAQEFKDSVGIGCYRIDLHPSSNGVGIIDFAALPFQIPLGAFIPVRMRNLIPACKNIGTTHITNGCYRLHPVEWNIGEAAGLLAGFCLLRGLEPHQVHDSSQLTEEFQSLLVNQGIELAWPDVQLGPV